MIVACAGGRPGDSPVAMQQLDIFEDSDQVRLEGELGQALLAGDAAASRAAWAALAERFPDHPRLAAADTLVAETARLDGDELADLDAALAERSRIEGALSGAAAAWFGREASTAWLCRCWRSLAQRARRLPWRREAAAGHAAAAWIEAGDWAQARDAVHGIESWRRIPQPLAWAVTCGWRLDGRDATWPLLAELCWLAPTLAARTSAALPDRRLQALTSRFEQELDAAADDWAWLPAWLLVDQGALLGPLSAARRSAPDEPVRAFEIVLGLLALERQGRHDERIARRRQLQQASPRLFTLYMQSR